MTGAKNATTTQRMSVAEFEKKIPANVELRRVRIEKSLVTFGLGYDKKEDFAILWKSDGKAYIRPMTKKGVGGIQAGHAKSIRFNGWLYSRAKQYDLNNGDEEK